VIVLGALIVAAVPAFGQESGDEWKAPHKNGHTFSSLPAVPDAFVRSYFRNDLGIAQTFDIDIPLGVIEGDTLFSSRGSLLFANLAVEYQQTIKDWIAFRAKFNVLGRLGTGTSALLTTGITANIGFELGWLVRILETDRGYLSGSFDVKNTNFTSINIAKFVEDIINDRNAELVRTTPSLRTGVGLRYTHAFSPLVGLVSFGETGYGESVDRVSDDEWFFRFGGTLDLDLAAVNWLPIGLAAGYIQDSFPEGGADIAGVTRGFLFRIGYTGRRDLALGLNLSYQTFPTKELDKNIKTSGATFDIRYYF
jgi:hypothetical protein